MATAKDRLKTKPKNPTSESGVVRLPAPIVRVAAPQVKVDVPAPQVNVDTKEFARALDDMARQFNAALAGLAQTMAAHDKRLIDVSAENQRLLKAISERRQAAPTVNLPERPSEFYVEIDKDRGETVGMRIRSE